MLPWREIVLAWGCNLCHGHPVLRGGVGTRYRRFTLPQPRRSRPPSPYSGPSWGGSQVSPTTNRSAHMVAVQAGAPRPAPGNKSGNKSESQQGISRFHEVFRPQFDPRSGHQDSLSGLLQMVQNTKKINHLEGFFL